jgi:hypothetical protein
MPGMDKKYIYVDSVLSILSRCVHEFEPFGIWARLPEDKMVCKKCDIVVPFFVGEAYNEGFKKGKEVRNN